MTGSKPEQEWSDQERALRDEREGIASDGADRRVAQYRLLARILGEHAPDALPPGFAERVATLAEAGQGAGDRIERWTERILFAALALAGVIFTAANAPSWLQETFGSNADSAGAWAFAIGACIALSMILDFVGRRVGLSPRA